MNVMTGAFPHQLALQKPQQTIEPANFDIMWRTGKLDDQVKRDGNRVHIVPAKADTKIYSRNGILDLTAKLPHVVAAVADLPPGPILDGEIFDPANENTEALQAAMNGDTSGLKVEVFDMLYANLSNRHDDYGARKARAMRYVAMADNDVVRPIEQLGMPRTATYQDFLAEIERRKIEGAVVWDLTGRHNINEAGNGKRGPAWKIKIRQTEDLVALGANACADATLGCGSLNLARRMGGRLVPIGKVGSFELGFDRRAAMRGAYPMVVEVSHYGEDDRGNLMFAKIVRARPDLHRDFGIAA